MQRDSFIFYRSFYEAIRELPRDIQGEVLTAIMEYGLDGATTENLKPVARAIVTLIKPQIDANNKRFDNGKKGGRPPKSKTEQKPNDNQTITEQKPNDNQTITEQKPNDNQSVTKPKPNKNVNDNVNVNDNKKEKVKKESSPIGDTHKSFKSFSLQDFAEQLKPYVEEYGQTMIRQFYDYWTEPNSRNKPKFQLEKTWDTARRLRTWKQNEEKFGIKTQTGNRRSVF
ncbi:DUF6291 domain-containing protein [Riemerella columbina]|uniref:DUF6291 domain-containing protein n=1 Tax=Riemerella columbina TaxID=103810 RepID=UPI00037E2CD0|nr:DUF6291 domain-containing protein [Riemerella columbina]